MNSRSGPGEVRQSGSVPIIRRPWIPASAGMTFYPTSYKSIKPQTCFADREAFGSSLISLVDQARLSRCPSKRAGGEDKKGRDQILPFPSIPVSAKRRGGKGMAGLKTVEARIGKREITAFLGEPNALLPRHGCVWSYGESSIRRTHSKNACFKKKTVFFLNQMGDDPSLST